MELRMDAANIIEKEDMKVEEGMAVIL